jgi:hypothetical protein
LPPGLEVDFDDKGCFYLMLGDEVSPFTIFTVVEDIFLSVSCFDELTKMADE